MILSFKYALEGIIEALREEPNLKFHLSAALVVIGGGFLLGISKNDWILVLILIGLVISLELTNTAIETVVDSFVDREHPAAKTVKDISAGAVLIVAIVAIIVGIIVFSPYIINLWITSPYSL